MTLESQTVTASPTTAKVLPLFPLGGPYPPGENSRPSTSTPLSKKVQPPDETIRFPETVNADGAEKPKEGQTIRKKIIPKAGE